MILLINGIFFQRQSYLDVTPGRDGPQVFINAGMFMTTFFGACQINPDGSIQNGYMSDHYGYSDITKVIRTKTDFGFEKKYSKRSDIIHYDFDFDSKSKLWVGTYDGRATGGGLAKATLQEVSDEFFDMASGLEFLGREVRQIRSGSS